MAVSTNAPWWWVCIDGRAYAQKAHSAADAVFGALRRCYNRVKNEYTIHVKKLTAEQRAAAKSFAAYKRELEGINRAR